MVSFRMKTSNRNDSVIHLSLLGMPKRSNCMPTSQLMLSFNNSKPSCCPNYSILVKLKLSTALFRYSQIGFIIMRNKRAERICELSGNSRQHLSILDKLKDKPTSGEPSLQNALEMALSTLKVCEMDDALSTKFSSQNHKILLGFDYQFLHSTKCE